MAAAVVRVDPVQEKVEHVDPLVVLLLDPLLRIGQRILQAGEQMLPLGLDRLLGDLDQDGFMDYAIGAPQQGGLPGYVRLCSATGSAPPVNSDKRTVASIASWVFP